jgi:hypothetical protein
VPEFPEQIDAPSEKGARTQGDRDTDSAGAELANERACWRRGALVGVDAADTLGLAVRGLRGVIVPTGGGGGGGTSWRACNDLWASSAIESTLEREGSSPEWPGAKRSSASTGLEGEESGGLGIVALR